MMHGPINIRFTTGYLRACPWTSPPSNCNKICRQIRFFF